jgi:hypothetical protein
MESWEESPPAGPGVHRRKWSSAAANQRNMTYHNNAMFWPNKQSSCLPMVVSALPLRRWSRRTIMSKESNSNFNDIRVRSFIRSGAPEERQGRTVPRIFTRKSNDLQFYGPLHWPKCWTVCWTFFCRAIAVPRLQIIGA